MPAAAASHRSPELLCDIGSSGQLLEFGQDPLERHADCKSLGIQTDSYSKEATLLDQVAAAQNPRKSKTSQLPTATSAQVLRVAVGLLGLELHEKPHPWAEAWLTFQDVTAKKLGLSSFGEGQGPNYGGPEILPIGKEANSVSTLTNSMIGLNDFGKEGQVEWQQRVLSHLRRLYDSREGGGSTLGKDDTNRASMSQLLSESGPGGASIPSLSSGSPFREQLDLSEFALRRITHCVNVLGDPEQNDRPMVLREYTEEQVMEVCKDLRQWLEQLAVLLSLYHVHILDLESERNQLSGKLRTLEAKAAEDELERKDAVARFTVIDERWKEEKMKKRAEALLGIKNQGEDAKIYSQKEVDEMMQQWEKTHIKPLLDEIKDLKATRDELLAKLQGQKKEKRPTGAPPAEDDSGGLGRKELNLINACMAAASERILSNELGTLLVQVGETIQDGGAELQSLLKSIQGVPIPQPEKPAVVKEAPPQQVVAQKAEVKAPEAKLSKEMLGAFNLLEQETKAVEDALLAASRSGGKNGENLGGLAKWAGWMRKSIVKAKESKDGAPISLGAAPKWALGSEETPKSTRAIGIVTDPMPAQKAAEPTVVEVAAPVADSKDWQGELDRLRREMEAKLRAAQEEAERQKNRAEEALQRLADETKRADQMLNELRKRLQEMERLLQKAGLGKEAADAIWEAGLADFMQGRDVFDRLYRDALRRMRSQAEAQARLLEESSASFMRVLHDLSLNPMSAVDAAIDLFTQQSSQQLPRYAQPRADASVQVSPSRDPSPSRSRDPSQARIPRGSPSRAVLSLHEQANRDSVDSLAEGKELLMISGLGRQDAPGSPVGNAFAGVARGRPKPPILVPQSQQQLHLQPSGGPPMIVAGIAPGRLPADGDLGSSQAPAPRSRSPPPVRGSPSTSATVSHAGAGGYSRTAFEEQPPLAVSSIGPRAAPSGLIPPPAGTKRSTPSQLMPKLTGPGSRAGTPSQVLKSAGTASLPQLSPSAPRVLVSGSVPSL
eukprot:TRINITY_DN42827_c0_g1_i1.p1 TRINITY_DN42827_c0_g1~~TRINITY_DN42827_c0_g1_i1.p1  ORF type:complete len:1007 (+),score=235.57 TRINITY_DN42827_c0_g1_i1:68-3088(+)